MKIKVPGEQTEVSVAMKQPVLNRPIASRQFQLTAPAGVPEELL